MKKIPLYLAYQEFYLMQILFVIGILSVLVSIALGEYQVPKIKAYMTEALGISSILKQEIVLFHSLTGRWPDFENLQYVFTASDGTFLYPGIEIKNGSFKIPFDTHNAQFGVRELAFHRVEFSLSSATVLWACGPNTALGDAVVHREFKTNLEERYLFSICKP